MKYSPRNYAKSLIELEQNSDDTLKNQLVKNLLKTLEKNNDIALLKEIISEYTELKNKASGKKRVKIEYGGELDEKFISEKFDADTELDFIKDPKLYGGMRIYIKDFRIDNSINRRLINLKKITA